MRPEEVFRIKGSNVFLDKGYLFNPYGKTKAAKRKIPLNEQAIDILSRRASEAKGPYLFPATRLVLLTDQEKPVRSSKARTPRLAIMGCTYNLLKRLEAAIGIEPMNKGFADLCLTAWLRRLVGRYGNDRCRKHQANCECTNNKIGHHLVESNRHVT